MDDRDKIQQLLMILQDHAPNGDAQFKCAELLNTVQKNGADLEAQEAMLVYALADGLAYGNWPWTLDAANGSK